MGDNEVEPNRLFHFVVPHFWEPKKYPFSGTNIFVFGTLFSIPELREWPARGQQNNLKHLAVLSLSTSASGITTSCYGDGVLPPPLSSSQPLVAR